MSKITIFIAITTLFIYIYDQFYKLAPGISICKFEFITMCKTMVTSNLSEEIISIPMETVIIMHFPQTN